MPKRAFAFLALLLAGILPFEPNLTASQADSANLDSSNSELRPLIERYNADRGSILRFYSISGATERRVRLKKFYREIQVAQAAMNFDSMSQDGKIDYLLLRNDLSHELQRLDIEEKEQAENAAYIPFGSTIIGLEEARRHMQFADPVKSAATLSRLNKAIEGARRSIEAELRGDNSPEAMRKRKIVGNRAALEVAGLRNTLRSWFIFYNAYDPLFTWWDEEAYRTVDSTLNTYSSFLRERVAGMRPATAEAAPGATAPPPGAGVTGRAGGGGNQNSVPTGARAGSTDDIVGNPIGRDALQVELNYEMIPYSPEQLIAIANKEYAWCEAEMKKAAREMGFGDDWKAALEKVKTMYVDPGKQPQMIKDLALEAEKFLDDHNLVTVPPVARETWRMEMMSPEQQLIAPFFLGGETIRVSFPVNTMNYEQKMTTMRGNNIPMARATVFHELIPGHHLQVFYAARYKTHRAIVGGTPFVTEGWSLYWELMMWDMKFQKTPEDRVGALVWRMHRCARIIFSLSFHLGRMTPDQAIDFLVDKVGFERENATGEVRRSFGGGYGPLYQAAYLLGGIQLRSLHDQLVGGGKLTERQFNDAILMENRIPIELIRASLTKQKLTREYTTTWKFYGEVTQ